MWQSFYRHGCLIMIVITIVSSVNKCPWTGLERISHYPLDRQLGGLDGFTNLGIA